MKFDKSINTSKPYSYIYFIEYFSKIMKNTCYNNHYLDTIILCIGTDRATGDCLGPLVGHKLKNIQNENIHILGSLDKPVHARNLDLYIRKLKEYRNPFVIAIDACLGRLNRVGFINIKEGPLCPGTGVNKTLPCVGNISVTGIVNVSGFMETEVLQSTRLSLVMNMADTIAGGIRHVLWNSNQHKDINHKKENKISVIQ